MSDNESSSDESIEPISPKETEVEVIEEEDYDYLVKEKKKEIYKDDKPKKEKKLSKKEKKEIDDYNSSYGVEPQYKKKPKGRPKKPIEEKLAKQVITKEKIIYMVQNEKGEFEKAKNPKLTAKELKKMELEKEKERKEIELGKRLQTRKNGKIDNRSSKPRTPAQIEATRKLVEANKKRREEKNKYKKEETKQIVKDSVREVVNEPFYQPKPVKKIDPYENLVF
tara:strand:- start:1277 stop:1948 length:672 start_codon:yes stop_codon:yes gene_type:complete